MANFQIVDIQHSTLFGTILDLSSEANKPDSDTICIASDK